MNKVRWFDFSLVTAVLFLFAVVLSIWLNFYPAIESEGSLPSITQFYGWPLRAATVYEILEGDGGIAFEWNWTSLVFDTALGVLILFCAILVGRQCNRAVAATKAKWLARPWHIMHLSTTVTLAMTAGGVLWTNFVWRDMDDITVKLPDAAVVELKRHATPFRIADDDQPVDFKFVEMKQQGAGWPLVFRFRPESFLWDGTNLLLDILFGLTVLVIVHVISEERIRRNPHQPGL